MTASRKHRLTALWSAVQGLYAPSGAVRRQEACETVDTATAVAYGRVCSTLQQCAVATKERFTVNIDADQLERLQVLAKRHGVSMAWLGRQAIARFLADEAPQSELPFPPTYASPQRRGPPA